MSKKSENTGEIIFAGETDSVIKWRKSGLRDFWIIVTIFVLEIIIFSLIDEKFLSLSLRISKETILYWFAMIGVPLFILIILGVIQPLRITERGIYPPTRGILNIFLMRERFIPFSKIKEFRVYNPWIEKFTEEWARMSKREREAKEIMESDYDIVLKNGKVIKMSGWTTAFYFSKNLPSVRKMR